MKTTFGQDKLEPGETIEREFGVGNTYVTYNLILWCAVGVLLFAVGIGVLIFIFSLFYFLYYIKRANQYAFTNKRILIMHGLLSTQLTSIDFGKITDIHIRQGFMEKMLFKTGSLHFETAGVASQLMLKHIEDPYRVKKDLDIIRGRNTQPGSSNQTNTPPQAPDTYQELQNLATLKDKGIITQEEFDAKKKQILGV
jgi:uncharacterized membrane protein YdbT with pleckstrin-like domain